MNNDVLSGYKIGKKNNGDGTNIPKSKIDQIKSFLPLKFEARRKKMFSIKTNYLNQISNTCIHD